ncbi:hypothetical protein FB192DRAFT_1274326 [Mucor lusitanicus]|uniref:DM2 domain-containing protein n=1 Tax=Mucor circinelloides f. lusitanicus TaxID=29924 RepID=A0A8H4BP32_MUCCL|nr:hypothetical protein FB192DRAFT_1274326 [Mucor lusitanicus]
MASRQPVHSVLFDNNQDQNQYYSQPPAASPASAAAGGDGLQFYASNYGDQYSANTNNYYSSPPTGDMHAPNYNYTTGSSGSFWSAFGTGGFADEPPLLEELGLNFGHIKTKSLAVLNPFRTISNKACRKKRPTDRNNPPRVEAYVPESKLYTELSEFEKNLDVAIMRKRLDIQEALGKPTKVRRTLRIFVSNTAADQPGQLEEATSFELNDDNAPSWTLRIEGRLLDPLIPTKKAQPVQKFTSFFKTIIVELDRDPEAFPEGNITEWHKQANAMDTDGVELKRKGDVDVNARIILVPDFNPQKYKLSPALAEIVSPPLAAKPHILNELWNYVKLHQLHDKQDKRVIQCDDKLTDLFGSSQVQFSDLPDLINRHLSQPDPIVLEYKIRVDKQFNQGPMAYDMDVELDSILRQKMLNIVASSQPQKEVMALDDKIVQCVQSINNSKVKRDFLTQFSMNPIEFTNKWITSQARDLETQQRMQELLATQQK